MAQSPRHAIPTPRQSQRRSWRWAESCIALCLLPFIVLPATAQQAPPPVYATGNAVVTGFSGAPPPVQIAPGVDPNRKTFIDVNGPSLRVVDLQHLGGPPAAQVVAAPKPFTAPAAAIGQVFGVTLDDSTPPNIYAAATSAYGLAIVARTADGQLEHVPTGTPNATFMPGLWGPRGGPGSIWKIDGVTGTVSLFANVMRGSEVNSGAALGGLAFDAGSKTLYATDRESGFIHRFGINGAELGVFDHGVRGRAAQGLPPVAWTSRQGIDVTSSQFDSTQPSTLNYATPERRIFGLAVQQRRLYYAVADGLQIWSVGLKGDGAFDDDAIIELAVPPASGPTEISRITFDEQGRMFLAERAAPTGAFDFEALAVAGIGRVLRFAVVGTTADGRRIWQQDPADYAIGFAGTFNNGDGGVAIGYLYDARGNRDLDSCGGFMWATGEALRHPADPALAAQLAPSGPLDLDGLQGNGTWLARPANTPPLKSYFIDYADTLPDPAARGHLGDITIKRSCAPRPGAAISPLGGPPAPAQPGFPRPRHGGPPQTPPPPPNKPPGSCPPDQLRRGDDNTCVPGCARPNIQINGKCCAPGLLAAGGPCSNSTCPSGQTAVGPSNFCCNSGQVYTGANGAPACCSGALVNGQCQNVPTTPTNPSCPTGSNQPPCCATGYVTTGATCCLAGNVTSTGVCCPSGTTPSGSKRSQCLPIIQIPNGPQCCATGLIPAGEGKCCPPANVTTAGECCSAPVDPANRTKCPIEIQLVPAPQCAAGYTRMPDGSCCNDRFVGADGRSCNATRHPCASGEFRAPGGACEPIIPPEGDCPSGQIRDERGSCNPAQPTSCGAGKVRDRDGKCVSAGPPPPPPVIRRHDKPPSPPPHRRRGTGSYIPPDDDEPPPPAYYGYGPYGPRGPGGRMFLPPRRGFMMRGRGMWFGR